MKNKLILLPFILMLAACGDTKFEHICHDGAADRPCEQHEIAMIDGMHSIIKSIQNFNVDHLKTSFDKLGHHKNVEDAKILLFGEVHTDVIGQIENLGAINALLGAGDILLLEGGDRKSAPKPDCTADLVFGIYTTWVFEQQGKTYVPKERSELGKMLSKTYQHTKKSYDFGGLNLKDIACGYWDDREEITKSVDSGVVTRQSLIIRNDSMVTAIENNVAKYLKVAVIAGAAHLPLGDMLVGLRKNADKSTFPNGIHDFYKLVEKERAKPKLTRTYNVQKLGTTKAIKNYLDSSGEIYIEMIHSHAKNAF